ncbi:MULTISPECIES: hemerythrin domain-containing protein [Roseivirga]|jgi:regulator of cell morphogenesis and NO signaling|uniref:hemerythrin domain-containing protein n=1 Tax=Roseivirga TaxID=290180 RepID=UPI00258011B2|nr:MULTISPECIES: hemerythrin domain-containing protein [Roseivirga]MEC7754949.1 hemerythrin domain-containing protein [Bacteroidota bacterium]|tara:strand:+ start:19296 stop:20048 length:753 start_codon:yes stop_codon:yes gene_type:complete
MENLLKRTINDLVTESHIRASVLYYFGVKFYDYKTETLEDVCSRHGLRAESVMKAMELVSDNNGTTKKQLQSFPVELMVEYLKHAHYLFVKKRIPYIAQLIDGLQTVNFRYQSLSADLKSVFPLFVEDFIEHIYEEEDTFFSYVSQLSRFLKDDVPSSEVFYLMEKYSVKEFALDHEVHDNEMEGFRKFTNNYTYCEEADLQIKVLYSELERLEKDLILHAKIENEILFPKALQLERLVKLKFYDLAKHN